MRLPDPRVRIIFCFLFALLVATSQDWEIIVLSLFTSLFLLALFKAYSFGFLRRLLWADLFLLMVVITLPFTTSGELWWHKGPLSISKEGLILALMIFFKANAILLATFVLLGRSNVFELAHALHHLRLPSRLVQLFFFTCRYLELLQREFYRLQEAAKLRGFVPGTNLRTYRAWAYLFASLFLRSYDRSLRVYQAMLLRGYKGYFPVWYHFSLKRNDIFWLLGSSIYLVFMAIWSCLK